MTGDTCVPVYFYKWLISLALGNYGRENITVVIKTFYKINYLFMEFFVLYISEKERIAS